MARQFVRRLTIAVALVLVAFCGVIVYASQTEPLEYSVVYAVGKDFRYFARELSTHRLMQVQTCPTAEFEKMAPLGYLVSAMSFPTNDRETAESIFDHFQMVGCDINELHEGKTPLHLAVLFGSPETVSFLLKRGADPEIRIRPPSQEADMNSYEFVERLCRSRNYNCDPTRRALNMWRTSQHATSW